MEPSSVEAARKVSPNWSQETMTCHSSNCFSIVWGQGNAPLVTSKQLLHDPPCLSTRERTRSVDNGKLLSMISFTTKTPESV